MRIAINATIVGDKPTGLGIYTINVVREMSKLIAHNDKFIVFTSCAVAFEGCNLEIRRVSKWVQPKYGKKAGLFRFLWTQMVFPIRLIEDNVDLIYNPAHYGVFFAGKPQVITIHDLIAIRFPRQHRLQYYYFKFVLPILLKNCSAVITISKNTKRDVCNYYSIPPRNVNVVYDSHDSEFFKTVNQGIMTSQYNLDYLLIVGASYPHKNIDRVLEAYSKIKNKVNYKLLIVGGRKQYVDILRIKARALRIEKVVEFLDYIPSNSMVTLYSRATALVVPSLYEGFGLPPLEAMACECPVLVSNSASLPEVCGDAAYYVDPYSVENIAEGMYKVLTDDNLRKSLIQKGLERVKMFSWKNTAKEILDTFEKVMGEP